MIRLLHIKIKSEDLTEIEVNKSAMECLTDGGICEESDSQSDDEIEGLLKFIPKIKINYYLISV